MSDRDYREDARDGGIEGGQGRSGEDLLADSDALGKFLGIILLVSLVAWLVSKL